MTLPQGPGERHYCLFALCRALKGLAQYAGADADDLWDVFAEWFRQATPFIRTKDPMISWHEFCDGWERVQFPMGQNPMCTILERAKAREVPAALAKYGHAGLSLLANVCAELQASAGDGPFYLSANMAGKLLNVSPMTAWRYGKTLIRSKLLVTTEPGTKGPRGKASRYRYSENGAIPKGIDTS
jgi:hypothetical protein